MVLSHLLNEMASESARASSRRRAGVQGMGAAPVTCCTCQRACPRLVSLLTARGRCLQVKTWRSTGLIPETVPLWPGPPSAPQRHMDPPSLPHSLPHILTHSHSLSHTHSHSLTHAHSHTLSNTHTLTHIHTHTHTQPHTHVTHTHTLRHIHTLTTQPHSRTHTWTHTHTHTHTQVLLESVLQ